MSDFTFWDILRNLLTGLQWTLALSLVAPSEAYRAQEAKIDGIAADVKDVTANALDAAKAAASDTLEAAKDAASAAVAPLTD